MVVVTPPAHLSTARKPWERLLRRDPCTYCTTRPAKKTGTVDHITAKSRGGDNTMRNLTGACNGCNQDKGSESLLLFLLNRMET